MSKIILKVETICLCLVLCFFAPVAHAAEIFSIATTKQAQVGDTVVVEAHLNTEGKKLNAVEGVLQVLGDGVKIIDISVGGSLLTIWPRIPVAVPTSKGAAITFTGGLPGGFIQSDALLFKVALSAEKPGKIVFQPENIVSYENDGKGTKIPTSMSSFTLTVLEGGNPNQNLWEKTIAADVTPPIPFTITLGQSPSAYDNKKFISFSTTDAESGVDYYEVVEGSRTAVRVESPYVLEDQSLRDKIVVIAYDKAGNTRTAMWEPEQKALSSKGLIGIFLGISCILILLVAIVLRRNKKS